MFFNDFLVTILTVTNKSPNSVELAGMNSSKGGVHWVPKSLRTCHGHVPSLMIFPSDPWRENPCVEAAGSLYPQDRRNLPQRGLNEPLTRQWLNLLLGLLIRSTAIQCKHYEPSVAQPSMAVKISINISYLFPNM